jgi:chromosome segregation ATPase
MNDTPTYNMIGLDSLDNRTKKMLQLERELTETKGKGETMSENKCDSCKKEFAKCDGKTKVWGIDKNPNATGKEADMVLECDAYEQVLPGGVSDTIAGWSRYALELEGQLATSKEVLQAQITIGANYEKQIAELKNELAKAHKQIQVDQSRIEQLEGELAVAKETIQAQITIGANYEKQIASLKSEVDVLTSCRNHWKISYVELKKALRDLAGIETSRATNNSPVSKEAK